MAAERGLRLVFGPKRGQWRIEVDEDAEERVAKAVTGGHGSSRLGHTSSLSVQSQRGASMHALTVLRSIRTMHTTDSENTSAEISNGGRIESPAPTPQSVLNLDPARLALPRTGYKREELRDELAKIKPIDENSASDQVSSRTCFVQAFCL
jgi:hypothetical protein